MTGGIQPNNMKAFIDALTALVASDRPGRAVSRLCEGRCWERALELLSVSSRVAVVTGFYVPAAGAAETDGPGGAAVLARALSRSGRECRLFTDSLCLSVVKAASEALSGVDVQAVGTGEEIMEWLPDLVVFLERLGRASDGHYYNMRGEDIGSFTRPLDDAAELAKGMGIPVLAIGDGGNEVGMGALADNLQALIPGFASCLCGVSADVVVPVDVSNWGGYALSALLSVREGLWLGHSAEEERRVLERIVQAGAVDGVTQKGAMSVDGFELGVQKTLVQEMFALFLSMLN